jgi:hypothetical protein
MLPALYPSVFATLRCCEMGNNYTHSLVALETRAIVTAHLKFDQWPPMLRPLISAWLHPLDLVVADANPLCNLQILLSTFNPTQFAKILKYWRNLVVCCA